MARRTGSLRPRKAFLSRARASRRLGGRDLRLRPGHAPRHDLVAAGDRPVAPLALGRRAAGDRARGRGCAGPVAPERGADERSAYPLDAARRLPGRRRVAAGGGRCRRAAAHRLAVLGHEHDLDRGGRGAGPRPRRSGSRCSTTTCARAAVSPRSSRSASGIVESPAAPPLACLSRRSVLSALVPAEEHHAEDDRRRWPRR